MYCGFCCFKRATNNTPKALVWAMSAGIILFLATLFAGFTSSNGQQVLKRATGLAPSEMSEIIFGLLSILMPVIWLVAFMFSKTNNASSIQINPSSPE